MKRYEEIIEQTCADVKEEMKQSILDGGASLHYEKEYGTAWIDIEIRVIPSWMKITDVQVRVLHEDAKHKSPELERIIEGRLPDWFVVEDDMSKDEHNIEEFEERERARWLMSA